MKESEAAMSPAAVVGMMEQWPGFRALGSSMDEPRVAGFVEQWPYLQAAGLLVDGCTAGKARPSDDSVVELEYQFSLHRPGTADQFKAILLGRLYPDDRGESDYRELLASRRGKEHLFADRNLHGFALYVSELRLLFYSPLEDENLPGLQTALAPEAMQPLLDACLRPDPFGGEGWRLCAVEVLHYKPGQRCTLRYRLQSGDDPESRAGPRSLIGKMYSDAAHGERVFATMQELDGLGFGREATDGVQIPQPLGYLTDLQMVVMEDYPGVPLMETLSAPGLDEPLAMAARAAAKIHRCPLKIDGREHDTPTGLIRRLKRGVSKATQLDPDLTTRLEAGLRLIQGLAGELPSPEATLVHAGFCPREVLVGGDGVAIVDVDNFHNGDPAHDVGNFIADLRWQGLLLGWSEEKARSSIQTFLSAYRQAIPSELRQRIDFYYRLFLLRRACRVARRPWPKGQALLGSLIAEVFKAWSDDSDLRSDDADGELIAPQGG